MSDKSDVNSWDLPEFNIQNAAQMEILCELKFVKEKDAGNALRIQYTEKLKEIYDNGQEGLVATDKWKSRIYAAELADAQRIAKEKKAAEVKAAETKAEEKEIEETKAEEVKNKETKLRTATFFNSFRIWDRSRLFLLRTLHVVVTQTAAMNVIADPLSIASLASGIRLLIDTAILFRPIFSPTAEEARLSWRTRIYNQWLKDDRRKRMLNDLFWFPLNLAAVVCAFFTGGGSIIAFKALQIAGFGWDTTNESLKYSGAKRRNDHVALLKELDKHITDLNNKKICIRKAIDEKRETHDDLTTQTNTSAEIFKLQNKQANFDEEIKKFTFIKVQLKETITQERNRLWYRIATTCMVLIGMAMFVFPPTTGLGVVMLIGACVTLTGGSILNGLGKEIYDYCSSKWRAWFGKSSKATPVVTQLVVSNDATVAPDVTNVANVSNAAVTPDAINVANATVAPDATNIANVSNAAVAPDTTNVANVSNVAVVPDTANVSNAAVTPDTINVANATIAPDATNIANAADVANPTDVTNVVDKSKTLSKPLSSDNCIKDSLTNDTIITPITSSEEGKPKAPVSGTKFLIPPVDVSKDAILANALALNQSIAATLPTGAQYDSFNETQSTISPCASNFMVSPEGSPKELNIDTTFRDSGFSIATTARSVGTSMDSNISLDTFNSPASTRKNTNAEPNKKSKSHDITSFFNDSKRRNSKDQIFDTSALTNVDGSIADNRASA